MNYGSMTVGATNAAAAREKSQATSAEAALNHAEKREDTAIQRQVADMKAAGINPIAYATQGHLNGASSNASARQIASEAQHDQNKLKLLSTAIMLMMMFL